MLCWTSLEKNLPWWCWVFLRMAAPPATGFTLWGRPPAESEFKDDPIHPMHESNLVNILQGRQSARLALIGHTVVDGGPEALSRH